MNTTGAFGCKRLAHVTPRPIVGATGEFYTLDTVPFA
jgi:hypothetical protein